MSRKIFAIGGGRELEIYSEMFQLSGIKNPHVLLVPHAVPLNKQQPNYDRMYNRFLYMDSGCKIELLKSDTLADLKKTREMLSSSDIIYVSEGNTVDMIQTWKKYGFDEMLKEEWQKEKLLCGTSAGALCWFQSFSTNNEGILNTAEGLNFIDAHLTVHGQEKGAYEFAKQAILENNRLGILLTNGAAIEIVDDKYRIITSNEDYNSPFYSNKEKSCGIISYFQDNKYYENKTYDTTDFKKLEKSLVHKQ